MTYAEYGEEEKVAEEVGPDEEEEDGFTQGYMEEEAVEECAECGTAIKDKKKKVVKEIEGEEYLFCSETCAKEFAESVESE